MSRKLGLLNLILRANGISFECISTFGWDIVEVQCLLEKLRQDGFYFEQYFDENNHFSIRINWKKTDLLGPLFESFFKNKKDV